MMFSMFMAVFPFVWKAALGVKVFANRDAMILDLLVAPLKMMYYMLNMMLMIMVKNVIWKKMQLK